MARRITQPLLAFGDPRGLAFSPQAQSFIVAPAEGPSTVQLLTYTEDQASFATIDLAGADALNMAFDSRRGRLLVLEGKQIVAIAAGRTARFNPAHLAIQNPAGMTVDPNTGSLFILDRAIPRLVQVDPTSDGGLNAAAVFYWDVDGIPANGVRGVAVNPGTGHLFILGGTRTLYETSSTGQLLLTHDMTPTT